MHYATPKNLGKALCRHLPKCNRIVEPSVGDGALLESLLELKRFKNSQVIALDTNQERLKEASSRYSTKNKTNNVCFLNSNFLNWGLEKSKKEKFDAVVMNPPFNAKTEGLVDITNVSQALDMYEFPLRAPIELAFILTSLLITSKRGYILSVLPMTVFSGVHSHWIRNYLLEIGKIRYVHELPERSFPGIESRVYLLVFQKGTPTDRVCLLNHDLKTPQRMFLSRKDLCEDFRLDHSFYKGRNIENQYLMAGELAWRPLSSVSEVKRGTCSLPKKQPKILHTTGFIGGLWSTYEEGKEETVYIARIGRECFNKVGVGKYRELFDISDCVFRIQPYNEVSCWQLLFALRTILMTEELTLSLARGTGAKFIRLEELRLLKIPMQLSIVMKSQFLIFKRYQGNINNPKVLKSIEESKRFLRCFLGVRGQ